MRFTIYLLEFITCINKTIGIWSAVILSMIADQCSAFSEFFEVRTFFNDPFWSSVSLETDIEDCDLETEYLLFMFFGVVLA